MHCGGGGDDDDDDDWNDDGDFSEVFWCFLCCICSDSYVTIKRMMK
jgi:hypothetical protein